MGRPKGTKSPRRYWTKEEKLKAVKKVVDNHETAEDVRKALNINSGLLHAWIKRYIDNGESGLENKIKPGNPLSKYQNRKQLTELEELQFENMKLRIELERLKKGYIVEGVGRKKRYINLSSKNTE
ncbi:MAG: transposase [Bacilli bacterium]|nr:transposase [Bacilli bacterium]